MVPLLPFNPWTITPIHFPPDMELVHLRRLDTYYRETDLGREKRKAELEKFYLVENMLEN
jgi:hypothetical protein